MDPTAAYRQAVAVWTGYLRDAELRDRTAPHGPAPRDDAGVVPDYVRPPARRVARLLRLAASRRDRRLSAFPAGVVAAARETASRRHEAWLRANPCDCAVCVRSAAA